MEPGMTHFVTSYLTLGCLNDNKNPLIRIKFAKIKDTKIITSVKEVVICVRVAYPLLHVLHMVDSEEKSTMDVLRRKYETHVKELRQAKQLHKPWHVMGYYLNPQNHYISDFKVVYELKKMIGNLDLITKINVQLEDFKTQK
ncbi:hypothetical protein HN51_058286, partial [Arachis hypogaea]